MGLYHFLEFFCLVKIGFNSLLYVRKGQNLVCCHGTAGINQALHQLIVGDGEIAPPTQSGTWIHEKTNQNPAGGILYLLNSKISGIYLVNGSHHVIKLWKTFLSTIIFVDDPRAGRACTALSLIFSLQLQPFVFAGMVVEPESASLYIWYICQTVIFIHLNQSVL